MKPLEKWWWSRLRLVLVHLVRVARAAKRIPRGRTARTSRLWRTQRGCDFVLDASECFFAAYACEPRPWAGLAHASPCSAMTALL